MTDLTGYRVFVFFDLPTTSKPERRAAAQFRKDLIGNGFCMIQYSVYCRFCHTSAVIETHLTRLRRYSPDTGSVRILVITEKEYTDMILLAGKKKNDEKTASKQLSFL